MPGLISCKDTGHWTCWDHGAGPPTHQKEKMYLPIFAKGQFRHPSSGPQSWTHQVQTARLPAFVKPVREILCIFCWYRFVDSHGKSQKPSHQSHAIPVTPFRIEPPATPPFRSATSSPGLAVKRPHLFSILIEKLILKMMVLAIPQKIVIYPYSSLFHLSISLGNYKPLGVGLR